VNYFTPKTIIILMETIKSLYNAKSVSGVVPDVHAEGEGWNWNLEKFIATVLTIVSSLDHLKPRSWHT
jgi:hypothetical protein